MTVRDFLKHRGTENTEREVRGRKKKDLWRRLIFCILYLYSLSVFSVPLCFKKISPSSIVCRLLQSTKQKKKEEKMSFTPRIGFAAFVHARSQSIDTLLKTREGVLAESLAKATLYSNGYENVLFLAAEVLKVRELRKNLNDLEMTRATLEHDVAEIERCISHKAWIYPEQSVHGDLQSKAKKEEQLRELNQKLTKIYIVSTKD